MCGHVGSLNQVCTVRGRGARRSHPGPPDAQAVRIAEPVDDADRPRARRPGALRAEPQADEPVAVPRARAGDRARIDEVVDENEAMKLRRAPTLVLVTARALRRTRTRRGRPARRGLRRLRDAARRDRTAASPPTGARRVLSRRARPLAARARGQRAGRRARSPRPAVSDPPARSGSPLDEVLPVPPVARRVRARGVEPPRAEAHRDLNPARLPVPPHPRAQAEWPRVESNHRTELRRLPLCPLSYGAELLKPSEGGERGSPERRGSR